MAPEKSESKRIPRTTAWRRRHGIPTRDQKDESQRYLRREDEQTLLVGVRARLQATGSIQASEVRTLATEIKGNHPRRIHGRTITKCRKPPGKNWATKFLKDHCNELKIRCAQKLGWFVIVADFVPMPSDIEQLCSKCVSINLQLETELSRRPNISRKVHTFQHSTEDIENVPCKLCRFVLACARSWNWPATNKYSLRIHHTDNVFGPTLADHKILISISIEDKSSEKDYQGWIVPTRLGDDASTNTVRAWGHLGEETEFGKIIDWLKFCDRHHSADCRMPEVDKIPFFQLIDCTTRSIVKAPDQAKYAALSYCWGDTSGSTIENSSTLPAVAELVIEDALEVASRLGIPYLWVDRFCISQSDLSIKPTQLQNMHKVYRSAYVTIVAGAGNDPHFGLPGVTTRNRKPQVSVETHGHDLRCIPNIEQEIYGCRWSTRGWTYQENLLSKRRLVFTESQTYFQCWNMHCCESTPLCLVEAHTKDLKRFKESLHTLRVFPPKGIGKTHNEIEARIQEYLSKHLTKDSDALDAFLGIFQAFQELEHPVYNFWGLPISEHSSMKSFDHSASESSKFNELYDSFLSSLAWSMDHCEGTSAHVLKRRHMFPSWTWAAWESLPTFSRKHITENFYSPTVSFQTYQGQSVELENFERALGSSNSTVLFEPYVYLAGWVTSVHLVQDKSDEEHTSGFQVLSPIPTHRVAIVADTETATSLRRQVLTDSFQVMLLGSESVYGSDNVSPINGLRNVHAIILQAGPNDTYTRLGVLTWSRLGEPSFNSGKTVMKVKEMLEARRIVPQCRCGCTSLNTTSFEHYLENPDHVLEFKRSKIKLV